MSTICGIVYDKSQMRGQEVVMLRAPTESRRLVQGGGYNAHEVIPEQIRPTGFPQ